MREIIKASNNASIKIFIDQTQATAEQKCMCGCVWTQRRENVFWLRDA